MRQYNYSVQPFFNNTYESLCVLGLILPGMTEFSTFHYLSE